MAKNICISSITTDVLSAFAVEMMHWNTKLNKSFLDL